MFRYVFFALALAITCCSCGRDEAQQQQPRFSDLVDKSVKGYCDSFDRVSYRAISKEYKAYLRNIGQKLERFPFHKDSVTHVRLAIQYALTFNYSAQDDSAIRYLEQVLPYLERHPEFTAQLAHCYMILGMSLNNKRQNNFKANYYATKAASICLLPGMDTVFSLIRKSQSLYLAAQTNMLCGQDEQALRFAAAAYDIVNPVRYEYKNNFHRAALVLADAYLQLKRPDSARKYLLIAQHWTDEVFPGDTEFFTEVADGKMKYFLAVKAYDSSLKNLLSFRSRYQHRKDYQFYILCYKIQLYTLLRQRAAAAQCLRRAEALLKEVGENDDLITFYRNRAQYFARYGTGVGAERAFLAFDSSSQEFYRRDRLKMFASIESEYNLTDKQKRLDQLNVAHNMARTEIRQKNSLLLVTTLGITLLVVILLLLLLFSRQRKLRAANVLVIAQRDRIELEQRLLRTQMEPHFIFNTLTAMQSLMRHQENEKAISYLNKFARLLRTSLEHSRENKIPLEEEVAALHDYISLQAVRFDGKFDYLLDVYEGYENDDVLIPPMLLQPFIENAIYHGLKGMETGGYLTVDIQKQGRHLVCTITDNGPGIEPQKTTAHKSLAINITRERLQMISRETGIPASVDITGRTDGTSGTVVRLMIPLA